MKKNIWFFTACLLFFVIGYNANDVAISFPKYKVAVVDITKILEKSPEIQSLKVSQDRQIKELNTLISKAQNEILNEPDKNKVIQMESEYRKQIETKQKNINDEYNNKLVKITSDIKSIISKEAKKSSYNLVLPTGMVISGGDDITQTIINDIK